MKTNISQEFKDEIRIIRESALQVRAEVSSNYLKREIDRALQQIDEILAMFESEAAMRKVIYLPQGRIRSVVEIRDRYGNNAIFSPYDSVKA